MNMQNRAELPQQKITVTVKESIIEQIKAEQNLFLWKQNSRKRKDRRSQSLPCLRVNIPAWKRLTAGSKSRTGQFMGVKKNVISWKKNCPNARVSSRVADVRSCNRRLTVFTCRFPIWKRGFPLSWENIILTPSMRQKKRIRIKKRLVQSMKKFTEKKWRIPRVSGTGSGKKNRL